MASRPKPAPAATAAAITEEAMYQRVVQAILDHRLPPGTKLVEDRLASAFGVSRTRVRPVLVRLANEQVVTLSPNRGASVAEPTEAEAREVFEVRQMIEPTLVARCIAAADAPQLQALARNIADEEAARAAGDARRVIRLSGEFHLLIGEAAGHATLARILRELVSRTSLVLMAHGDPATAPAAAESGSTAAGCGCTEHQALLQAITARDAERAAQLMREHLAGLQAQLRFRSAEDSPAPDLVALFGAPDEPRDG